MEAVGSEDYVPSTGTNFDEHSPTILGDDITLQDALPETAGVRFNSRTLLNAELSAMIALLRRQMSSARFFSDTGPIIELLDEFGKARMRSMDPRYTMTCREGLEPFIKLFKSIDTTGPIVIGALDSTRKLVLSEYFPRSPSNFPEDVEAFRTLFAAMAKCRFEATDLNVDEVALMKLVGTLLDGLRHPLSVCLFDADVLSAVETVFRLCFQSRFSELMRQSSSFRAVEMTCLLFSRLLHLDNETPSVSLKPIALPFAKVVETVDELGQADEVEMESKPFGVASLGGILEFISKLLDPNRAADDKVRCLAADVLAVILENTRDSLQSSPFLFSILSRSICKSLSGLLSITSSPSVLRHLLHPVGLLFKLYRRLFVSQFEHVIRCVMDALRSKPPANPKNMSKFIESKAVLLELLLEFVDDDDLIGDLYAHYECDMRYSMTFSELISCLCEVALNVDQRSGGSESTALLAMQLINTMLFELARSAKETKIGGMDSTLSVSDYTETRKMKLLMQEAAGLFNVKPKDAFAFLQKQSLLADEPSPVDLAKFLHRTQGLDKKMMGEFLAKPENEPVLAAFMADFEFQAGQTVDEALRKVLESFRLPGEAQQIDRIVAAFAKAYYDMVGESSGQFASVDATYVLAFSIVMLNTDLYNPQNQKRMTMDEFIRNNRGINDGADFDPALLRHIYTQISTREFVLPEETMTVEHIWNEVVRRADTYSEGLDQFPVLPLVEPVKYLGPVISLLFPHLLACYLPSTPASRTEEMSKLTFAGIDLLSRVLSDLEQHPLMAELIEALWMASGLSTEEKIEKPSTPTGSPSPQLQLQHQRLQASRIIRQILRSDEAALVLKTLFGIVHVNGPSLRAGWRTVVAALFVFADAGLITFTDDNPEDDRNSPTGSVFSSLSSYVEINDAEPIDADLRRRAAKVVSESCQLDRLIKETRYYQEDSLSVLLQALSQALLHRAATTQSSEASLVMILEIMMLIAWQNKDRLSKLWPTVSACLAEAAKQQHPKLSEHAVLGLGKAGLWLAESGGENVALLYFQTLCHVPPETFQLIAEASMALALKIIEAGGIATNTQLWPHYFTLLAQSSRLRSCDASTLGLLAILIPSDPKDPFLLPLEFFSEYIDLLIGFIANSISVPPNKVTPLSLASKDTINSPVSSDSLSMATQCLESLAGLHQSLRSQLDPSYLVHLHLELSKLCVHPSRILRQQALSLLQRMVLSLEFANSDALFDEFNTVLLPLLASLNDLPESNRRPAEAFEETQMRSASILCKILLHNLPLLVTDSRFPDLWSQLLSGLLTLMQGRSEVLRESVPESIKNMLLVMMTSTELEDSFWDGTWNLLDPVIPRLKQDLHQLMTPVQHQSAPECSNPNGKPEVIEETTKSLNDLELESVESPEDEYDETDEEATPDSVEIVTPVSDRLTTLFEV